MGCHAGPGEASVLQVRHTSLHIGCLTLTVFFRRCSCALSRWQWVLRFVLSASERLLHYTLSWPSMTFCGEHNEGCYPALRKLSAKSLL